MNPNQVWWFMPVIIVFERMRQEDCYEYKASLVYFM